MARSSYAAALSEDARKRYEEKISAIDGADPFLASVGQPTEVIPPLDASDLLSYLVLQTNFITTKQFKAHKSLEAYNQFVCGWVKDIHTRRAAGKFVITGRVRLIAILVPDNLHLSILCRSVTLNG